MILTILFVVCAGLFVLGLSKQVSRHDDIVNGRFFAFRIIGGLLGGGLLLGFISVNVNCYVQNADMLGKKQNIEVYQKAASSINGIAVVSPTATGGSIIGGVENMQQSQKPSELWTHAANLQSMLNESVELRKANLSNPWVNWWYIPLPKGL